MSYISKINVNGVEYDINSTQIHIGSSQPTDENIVLWVDTSAETTDPVTNLIASNITTSSVTLSWTASGNATSYKVYNGSTLLTTISGTSHTVTGLSEGTTYTFKVIATGTLGDSTAITVTATTQTAGATDPVTNLVASNITTSSVTLSWTASGNATSYKVYNGSTLLTTISGTSYTVTGLSEGTTYTFKVIATSSLGDAAAVTVTATTHTAGATDPVTNLTASSITTSSVTLSWTASENATSYKVYNGDTLLTTISETSHTVTGLSEGTTYTFKVIATGTLGDSTPVTVTATTHTAGILPFEYQQVNYVSPNKGAYSCMNLGIKVADTDKIVVTTEQDFGHINQLFGTGQNKEPEGEDLPTTFYPLSSPICIRNNNGSGGVYAADVWSAKGLQNFSVSSVPSEYVGLNIKATLTFEFTSTSERYWGIGGYMLSTESAYYTPQKIYDIKFYKNSELVAEFIPCYRKEDNKCGFYNITIGEFRHVTGTAWNKGDNA